MSRFKVVNEPTDVGVASGYTFQNGDFVADLLAQLMFRICDCEKDPGDVPCALVQP